jgi:hypothetical protein
MLEFISKKFVHCLVTASVIFGCSVQAATPSFKEDLDDFEEMYFDAGDYAPILVADPVAIFLQNEDLSRTLTSSYSVTDDLEQYSVLISKVEFIVQTKYSLITTVAKGFRNPLEGLHLARAPPPLV